MANYQLGPESPRPFSVLSENHVRRHVEVPRMAEHELFSFGSDYERKMCSLIDKYMELDTDDRVCYVGEPKGSLVPMLQDRFCLLEPITTVVPGHIHFEESPNHRMLPFKVANVGAEEFFHRAAEEGSGPLYDKILLKDVVRYMDNPRKTYQDALTQLTEFGKLVIIQRPADMTTLPIFSEAKDRMEKNEDSYMRIIQDLQACKLDVTWDVECLPIVMLKSKWYAMLSKHFPPQLEMVSGVEVNSGLRELSEGVLKYGDEKIEFVDRLLFITASRTVFSDVPQIARFGVPTNTYPPVAPSNEVTIRYEMSVTPDIDELIKEKQRRDRINGGRRGNGKT